MAGIVLTHLKTMTLQHDVRPGDRRYEISHTLFGKKMELLVRKVLLGRQGGEARLDG
jgi:hypothetical protein